MRGQPRPRRPPAPGCPCAVRTAAALPHRPWCALGHVWCRPSTQPRRRRAAGVTAKPPRRTRRIPHHTETSTAAASASTSGAPSYSRPNGRPTTALSPSDAIAVKRLPSTVYVVGPWWRSKFSQPPRQPLRGDEHGAGAWHGGNHRREYRRGTSLGEGRDDEVASRSTSSGVWGVGARPWARRWRSP